MQKKITSKIRRTPADFCFSTILYQPAFILSVAQNKHRFSFETLPYFQ